MHMNYYPDQNFINKGEKQVSLNMFGVYVIIKYKAEDNNPFVQITGSACIKHNDRDGFFKCGIFLAEDDKFIA